jgi:hypothetical protein
MWFGRAITRVDTAYNRGAIRRKRKMRGRLRCSVQKVGLFKGSQEKNHDLTKMPKGQV